MNHRPFEGAYGPSAKGASPAILRDEMTLESRGPVLLYYEFLYGIRTLNPFRVQFVLKDSTATAENPETRKLRTRASYPKQGNRAGPLGVVTGTL